MTQSDTARLKLPKAPALTSAIPSVNNMLTNVASRRGKVKKNTPLLTCPRTPPTSPTHTHTSHPPCLYRPPPPPPAPAPQLNGIELVKAVHIATEPFTPENGLVTPTLKLNRAALLEHYREVLDDLYSELNNYGSVDF